MCCKSPGAYPCTVQNISSMTPLDGVLLVIVVLHVVLHINVNACGQKFMLRSLGGVHLLIPKLGSKSVASVVVTMSCSLSEHAGGCERAVRGFFAWLPGTCRATRTHRAPPERAFLRVNGFCGASGEATTRGVNLYEDMAAACQQKEAASNTCTVRNGRKSQTCRQSSKQTWGVPNSPFQGLSGYTPHTPTSGTLSRQK